MNSSGAVLLLGVLALALQAGPVAAEPSRLLDAVATPPAAGPVPGFSPPEVPGALDVSTADAGRNGWVAGAGLYLIRPYFQNNMAYALQQDRGTQGQPSFTRSDDRVDVSQDLGVAPLVWLGYLGECGLGGRARYWYFSQDTSQAATASAAGSEQRVTAVFSAPPLGLLAVANPMQTMTVTTSLELQVADIEALLDLRAGPWDFLLCGGVRFARIEQTYDAVVDRGTTRITTLMSSHSFEGAGPVLALEARRPLGDTGLGLYGSGRAGILFGSADQDAALVGQNTAASDRRDRGLAFGELEAGLEYGYGLGDSWLFGQAALVGQGWFGAGSASRAAINVAPGGAYLGAGYVGDSDVGFVGLSLRLGVNY